MKIKTLPGTFGLGLVVDSFARSVYLTLLWKTIVFHRPRVGNCKTQNCGHGPKNHTARRDHGVIQWTCTAWIDQHYKCECTRYEPESA